MEKSKINILQKIFIKGQLSACNRDKNVLWLTANKQNSTSFCFAYLQTVIGHFKIKPKQTIKQNNENNFGI